MNIPEQRKATTPPTHTPKQVWTTNWQTPVFEWTSRTGLPHTYLQLGSLVLDESILGPALVNLLRLELEDGAQR